MTLFFLVVLAALAFEYINGFHDAANAIATVVSTKVLTPRQAITLAAFFNLTGALMGTAVASTIGKGMVDTKVITMPTILCALLGAIVWNLDHVVARPALQFQPRAHRRPVRRGPGDRGRRLVGLEMEHGLLPKVVIPMFTSPVVGFVVRRLFMFLLLVLLRTFTPHIVHSIFGKAAIGQRGLDGA